MAERAERAERVVPEQVAGLLEERSRIRGWLERLAELRKEATPAVYERVREDYESRLTDVGGQLSAHREELESSLATHREKVDALQGERDGRAAELEEAKLRFTVGEYDDAEWSRRREGCESALARLDERLEDGRGAVQELEAVLEALLSDGAPPAAGGVGPEPRAARAEPSHPEPSHPAAADPAPSHTESSLPEPSHMAPSPTAPPALQAPPPEAREPDGSEAPEARGGAAPEKGRESGVEEGAKDDEEPVLSDETEFMDELEFLESLSLDDAERFDAVSAMLEGKGEEEGRGDAKEGRR